MFADDVKVVGNPTNDMVQADLDTICRWTFDWDLPPNVGKCKLLVASQSVGPFQFLLVSLLEAERVTQSRDRGKIMSGDYTVLAQCLHAADKACQALFQLRRTVASRSFKVPLALSSAKVRPLL